MEKDGSGRIRHYTSDSPAGSAGEETGFILKEEKKPENGCCYPVPYKVPYGQAGKDKGTDGSGRKDSQMHDALWDFLKGSAISVLILFLGLSWLSLSRIAVSLTGISMELSALNESLSASGEAAGAISDRITYMDQDMLLCFDSMNKRLDSISDNIILDKNYIATGKGWMGVTLTNGTAQAGDMTVRGVILVDIMPGSPAEEAGLLEGDLVTEINGEPVTSTDAFLGHLDGALPGDEMTLSVIREGWTAVEGYKVVLGNSYDAHR